MIISLGAKHQNNSPFSVINHTLLKTLSFRGENDHLTRRGNPAYNKNMSNEQQYYVYILFSKKNGTLYTGVTSDIVKRVWEHKNKLYKGFTSKYGVDKLGYYEVYNDINMAIDREKQIKNRNRNYRLDLIEIHNPEWIDLYCELI